MIYRVHGLAIRAFILGVPTMRISPISIAALALVCSPLASASLIAPDVELCNSGEYAVGLMARAGPWINSIAPVCARWDNDHLQSGPLRTAKSAGGPGGNPIRQLCPAGTAIWSWRVSTVSAKGQSLVWAMSAQCKGLAPPHDFHPNILHLDAAGGLPAGPAVPEGKCQQGQLAVGMQVWSSVSQPAVIDIKMQCGRGPTVDMPMATTRNADGTITYLKPSFKLKSGDVLHVDWCQ
jgi:hypothetical protein